MKRSRAQMLLNFPRIMSILFFLPLLFAYRQPISVRPRSSILRRMPMFYGKRDPSLSAPSMSSDLSPVRPAFSGDRDSVADRDYLWNSLGYRGYSAKTRSGERNKLTPRQPVVLRPSVGDVRNLPAQTIPSALLKALQNYIDTERNGAMSPVSVNQERGARHYNLINPSEEDSFNRRAHPKYGGLKESSKHQSEIPGGLLDYDRDYSMGLFNNAVEETNQSVAMPLKSESSRRGDETSFVDYGYNDGKNGAVSEKEAY